MELNFKNYGSDGAPLIILHGLFGMLDNWSTLGRKFGETNQVYLLDQRNHGKSAHDPTFNYKVMAADLAEFIEQQELEKVHLIGHSMGGKTAMQFAFDHPEMLQSLIVADIAPYAYEHGHSDVLEAFDGVDLATIDSRKAADEALVDLLPDFGVRQFILKNLARNKEGAYFWRPAVAIIKAEYDNIISGIDGLYEDKVLFIGGERSDYLEAARWDDVLQQFPKADLEIISDAGHWVHAEQPIAFYEVVMDWIGASNK